MHKIDAMKVKHTLTLIGLFVLVSVIALWSLNTVSELFGGPHAQYRHVLAVFGLVFVARFLARGGAGRHGQHGTPRACRHG